MHSPKSRAPAPQKTAYHLPLFPLQEALDAARQELFDAYKQAGVGGVV